MDAREGPPSKGSMDKLNDWFNEQSQTPAGSLLVFLLVFLVRISLDRWLTQRERRKKARRKGQTGA